MIYIIKEEGLYQNKDNSSLVSNCNCKIGYLNLLCQEPKWSAWFFLASSASYDKTSG